MNRYEDWLRQAENDIEWAEHSLSGGFFAQVCFISQQAAEKALKAFCFFKGFDSVRTHSLFRIIRDLNENGRLEQWARELDLYYQTARYPDSLPAGAPFEIISRDQAERALAAARGMVATIVERIR